jgi:hypothetical protein
MEISYSRTTKCLVKYGEQDATGMKISFVAGNKIVMEPTQHDAILSGAIEMPLEDLPAFIYGLIAMGMQKNIFRGLDEAFHKAGIQEGIDLVKGKLQEAEFTSPSCITDEVIRFISSIQP